MEQRTEEWFLARKNKITGSRVGAILGLNPWQSANDVMRAMVREYHNEESEFQGNIATEYGTKFEPFAIGDFEMETGFNVIETGFHTHKDFEWLGASPDGLINDEAIIEVKCPYSKRDSNIFNSYIEQPHYYAQMQIEMACTNTKQCYFFQWSNIGFKLEIVHYSQAWFDENLPKLKAFYDKFLKECKAPDVHLSPLIQDKTAVELSTRYTELKQQIESLTSQLDDVKKQLIDIADGKKSNVSGLLVYQVERKGNVNYKKIPELKGVDLEQYRGLSTSYWVVK